MMLLTLPTLLMLLLLLVLASCTLTPWFGESDIWWFVFVTPMLLMLCSTFAYLSALIAPDMHEMCKNKPREILEKLSMKLSS